MMPKPLVQSNAPDVEERSTEVLLLADIVGKSADADALTTGAVALPVLGTGILLVVPLLGSGVALIVDCGVVVAAAAVVVVAMGVGVVDVLGGGVVVAAAVVVVAVGVGVADVLGGGEVELDVVVVASNIVTYEMPTRPAMYMRLPSTENEIRRAW